MNAAMQAPKRFQSRGMTAAEYIAARSTPDEATGCWLWNGPTSQTGYGHTTFRGRLLYMHRLSYEAHVGDIPEGLTLDHACHTRDDTCMGGDSCRHRRCVNPAHLEAVTLRENLVRGKGFVGKNTRSQACPKGHPYEAKKHYGQDARFCRTCARVIWRDYYYRVARPKKVTGLPPRIRRGSDSPIAKVTEQDVANIRGKAAAGATYRDLGREYGVSDVAVRNMVTRRTWKHVP